MANGMPHVHVTTPKRLRRSKVLAFNGVMLLLAALEAYLHVLQPVMRQDVYLYAFFSVGAINMVLRGLTTQPLALGQWRSQDVPTDAELDAARSPNSQAGFAAGELLGLLLAVVLSCGMAWMLGARHAERACFSAQDKAVAEATNLLANRLEIAQEEAASANAEATSLTLAAAQLQARLKQEIARAPIVVPARPRACADRAAAVPAPLAGGADAIRLGIAPTHTTPASIDPPGADAAGLVLSADAVRLWNAALLGIVEDAHPTTRADGTAIGSGADAASELTGLTPADAWANHITNATSCAQDRVRFGRLQATLKRWAASAGD